MQDRIGLMFTGLVIALVGVLLIANGTRYGYNPPEHTAWWWVGWAVLTAGAIVVMLGVVALGVVLGMGTLETLQTAQESTDGPVGDEPVAD